MAYTIKNLPKGMVEIAVEVSQDELKHHLENAARHISEARPLDGFRPGKAPYEAVAQRYGEMAIYEEAIQNVVRKFYVQAVTEAHLHTYGQPSINVTKLAPGNAAEFTATVAVIPHVEKLADFRKFKVEEKAPKIEDKQIEDALKEIQKMQTTEVLAERESKAGDKVVVDMDLSRGGVALEGGQARNHGIFIDEEYYIPGVKEQVIGVKAGDEKKFTVTFPKDHFQKHLAGQDVDFAVTVKQVFELQNPPLDDAFAAKLGQGDMKTLRERIRKNMEEEASTKEHQRAELELLEKLAKDSKFGEIPEVILNDETDRMLDELKHSIAERGLAFEDYLSSIKKSAIDLKLEFSAQAVQRVKTAILMREIGEKENVEVSEADVADEIAHHVNEHSHSPEEQERFRSEDYQDYVRSTMRNRKVLELLAGSIVKK
ncbi:MAG: hypothetical protein RLZZ324_895 [Candidatus Parcubacteria bacterium]|jgi:trigger factor